jgi:hypothetical protein
MYEPRNRQVIPITTIRTTMVQVKPTSELLGLEHGDAQVDEHDHGKSEQETLDDGHTRSRAQINASIPATKAMMPTTTRKSAMY